MHIYLMGMPGCGKTYWGKYLSDRYHIPHIDLDTLIEAQLGCSIQQAFETCKIDWTQFRNLESDILNQVSVLPTQHIISLGGTPCFNSNLEIIKNSGKSIYLKAATQLLADRLNAETNHRPLFSHKTKNELDTYLNDLFENRVAFYNQADTMVNAENPNWDSIAGLFAEA